MLPVLPVPFFPFDFFTVSDSGSGAVTFQNWKERAGHQITHVTCGAGKLKFRPPKDSSSDMEIWPIPTRLDTRPSQLSLLPYGTFETYINQDSATRSYVSTKLADIIVSFILRQFDSRTFWERAKEEMVVGVTCGTVVPANAKLRVREPYVSVLPNAACHR